MPKDRDRTANPATVAAKAQKAREIKKSKAATQATRTEKLARRNPDRLQKQLDELQQQKNAQGGKLRPKDQQTLEQLERDVRLVRKAREVQGTGGGAGAKREDTEEGERGQSQRGRGDRGRGGAHLGKRKWHDREVESEESATDEDVRSIPMPRDKSPPIPPRQYQRQIRRGQMTPDEAFAARDTERERQRKEQEETRKANAIPTKKSYESAPQIRDLTQEASSKFVPAAVAAKQREARARQAAREGKSERLLEPEELEDMEKADEKKKRRRLDDAVEAVDDVEKYDEMEEQERALLAELGESARSDARKAANAAEKEAKFEMIAQGRDEPDVERALERAGDGGFGRREVEEDIEGVAMEAEKEAEFEMMARGDVTGDGAVNVLKHVEMEEVEDEEFRGQGIPPTKPLASISHTPTSHGKQPEEDDFW